MATDTINDRILKMEWALERQEERLLSGAEAFSEIRRTIQETSQSVHSLSTEVEANKIAAAAPRPVPWVWLAGFSFSSLIFIGGLIWTFAKYPDAADFEKGQESNNRAHHELRDDLDDMKEAQSEGVTEQRLIKQIQGAQAETMIKMDGKLDLLLLPPRERPKEGP